VVNPGEFSFLFEFVIDDARLPDVNKYKEWLSTDRIFLNHNLKTDPNHEYAGLVRSFVEQKGRKN
jgi:hypothetical protein